MRYISEREVDWRIKIICSDDEEIIHIISMKKYGETIAEMMAIDIVFMMNKEAERLAGDE